ncbi:MFS transporter [Rhodococcus opacus]|uniref:MFS transporter n=1 Tax=Rhodococcus opacus TaxID=37919 RepID=UPI001056FA64|nr:MFS transporter [Rhodococcus opacus]
MSASEDSILNLGQRLNRIPRVTRTQRKWFGVLAILMILEMADLNAFAYVAPTLRAQWALTVDDVAAVSAAAFLGMATGALGGGALADRFGRKRMLVLGTVFYSAASLACAFADSAGELMVYRFLVGVGLYTVTTCALTFIAEMFPQQQRGRVQALVLAVALLGIPLMSWFSRWVVPREHEGWRWVFVVGAAGLIGALIAQRYLPESIRWNEARGRAGSDAGIVARLEAESETLLNIEVEDDTASDGRATFVELARSAYAKRTIVVSIVLALSASVFYGFNAWVPLLLTEHGFSNASSLTYTSVLALAACPGALAAVLFIDRFERRTSLMIVFILCALALVVFGSASNISVTIAAGIALSFLLYCSVAIVYTYTPEIFPTRFRALGTGTANGIGRLAAFGSMFVVAAVLGNIGFTAVFVCLAVAIGFAGILIGFFGQRTRGRTIDEVASRVAQVDSAPDSQSATRV